MYFNSLHLILFAFVAYVFCLHESSTIKLNLKVRADIEDGWYEATVKYNNYGTGTMATYTLNVEVKYDKVVKIDFGNGGSIHSGYNDSGYTYSGGYLSEERDYNGKIIAVTARVMLFEQGGNTRIYDVRIE